MQNRSEKAQELLVSEIRGAFYSAMTRQASALHFVQSLGQAARVSPIAYWGERPIVHAEINIPSHEGQGSVTLTRIGRELLVIVDNYSWSKPRCEHVEDGELVQFEFRVSGEITWTPIGAPPLLLHRSGLYVSSRPAGSTAARCAANGSGAKSVTLVMTRAYLNQEFVVSGRCISPMIRDLLLSPARLVGPYRFALSAASEQLVWEFFSRRVSDAFVSRMTAALASELLCTALAEIGTLAPANFINRTLH